MKSPQHGKTEAAAVTRMPRFNLEGFQCERNPRTGRYDLQRGGGLVLSSINYADIEPRCPDLIHPSEWKGYGCE